jgi:serine/threonine-protein kinase
MTPGELQVGAVVAGRFVLDERLGIGAFGTVWKAMDREHGYSAVALKLLHEHLAGEPRIKERFAREMRVLAGLEHPSIAKAIAWSEEGAAQYLAMEYVEGPTVRAELARRTLINEQYSVAEVGTIARAIASALQVAHAKGIVHRDLKPNNLVLSKEGVKVLDFGIARIADTKPEDETTIGRTLGSWQYMPPEQVRGERVDERCDLFALGAIMFELLTLRKAFARTETNEPMPASEAALDSAGINSRYNLLKRIVMEPRERPSRWREGLNEAIDRVVLCALESEREARFQNATEMFAALNAAFAAEKPRTLPPAATARARAETMLPSDLEETIEPPATKAMTVDPTKLMRPLPATVITQRETKEEPALRPSKRRVSAVTILSVGSLAAALIALSFTRLNAPVQKIEDTLPVVEARALPQVEVENPPSAEAPEQLEQPREGEEPVAEDPVREEVVRPQKKTSTKQKVVETPKADPVLLDIERSLAAAKSDPDNSEKLQAVATKLRERSREVSDPRARNSIERCATTSAVAGDLDALSACVDRLRSSLSP